MKHFKPQSPDPFLKKSTDMAPAKFGHLNAIVDVLTQQAEVNVGIIAFAAGGQASATLLIPGFNTIATAVNPLSSVILPNLTALCACTPCGPIAPVVIVNNTLNTVNVYPAVGESIDGLAVNTPIVLDPGESLSFKNISCDEWQTYNASGIVTLPAIQAQLQFEDEGVNLGTAGTVTELDFVGPGVTATRVANKVTVTVPTPTVSLGYAEYVQHTQGSNVSIAPGRAIEYLTDNPLGVFNTLGITTTTGPAGQGTEFLLPIGVYVIDFENSADAAWSLAIYKSLVTQLEVIDTNTIAGASTGTTWIHGRAIISAAAPTYIIISPVTGTQAIPTAGTAAGEFIARLTILKIA